MDVSIIIVSYNTKELTHNCLKSVFEQTKDIAFEVIVSDNGSTDGSVGMIKAEFPQVILIENNANLGFGAANNRGLVIAKGKYIFYLNSDTVLLNNAVKLFFDFWENTADKSSIGAIGTTLLDADGNPSSSYGSFVDYNDVCKLQVRILLRHICITVLKIFHLQKLYTFYKKRNSALVGKTTGDVEVIWGADLFVKNNNFAMFDEHFFLYAEEMDLEFQLKKSNLRRILIAGPEIIHLEGNKVRYDSTDISTFSSICQQISQVRYVIKNCDKKNPRLLKFLITIDWLNPFIPKREIRKALACNKIKNLGAIR